MISSVSMSVELKYKRKCLANNSVVPNFNAYLGLGKIQVLDAFQPL